MTTVQVSIRLRPLRVALAVDPADTGALRQALATAALQWGGSVFPIIPLYGRSPSRWHHSVGRAPRADVLAEALVETFDPDYIVPVGDAAKRRVSKNLCESLEVEDLQPLPQYEFSSAAGVTIFEVMRELVGSEMKFERKNPPKICLPAVRNPYGLYKAATVGGLGDEMHREFGRVFGDFIVSDSDKLSVEDVPSWLFGTRTAPFRLTTRHLNVEARGWRGKTWALFVLDPGKAEDVIDLVNLRALGWSVFPLPLQVASSESGRAVAVSFIQHFCTRVGRVQGKAMPLGAIISRNVRMKDGRRVLSRLTEAIRASGDLESGVCLSYYPRLWNHWEREYDAGYHANVSSSSEGHEISIGEGFQRVPCVQALVLSGRSLPIRAKYVNAVSFSRSFGSARPIASVLPRSRPGELRRAEWLIGTDARLTEDELSIPIKYQRDYLSLSAPFADAVMESYFQLRHSLEATRSPPGRVAEAMLRCLGGVEFGWMLASSGFLRLLMRLQDGRGLHETEVRAELHRLSKDDRSFGNVEEFLRRCIELRMIQVGARLRCPTCAQRPWYPVSGLDYEVNCPDCFGSIQFPASPTKTVDWSYRAVGPFAVSRSADGAFGVLLALRFFSHICEWQITPLLSSTLKDAGEVVGEYDLVFLSRRRRAIAGDVSEQEVLTFCESSSFTAIDEKDVKRLAGIGKRFKDSFLVLCTLNSELQPTEKRLVRDLIDGRPKSGWGDSAHRGVFVLTGTELFQEWPGGGLDERDTLDTLAERMLTMHLS